MVNTKKLSNTFLFDIQGINSKANKQKIKFALLDESVSTEKNILAFLVLTEIHISEKCFHATTKIHKS